MKTMAGAIVLLLGVFSQAQAAVPVYKVKVDLYRLSSAVTGKTEAANVILADEDADGPASELRKSSVFTAADLKIGKVLFHLDGKGVTWNGAAEPPSEKGSEIEPLSRPNLIVKASQPAQICVGQRFPVAHMEREDDGRFVQKIVQYQAGLTVDVTVSKGSGGNVKVGPLKVQIVSWKGKREKVEGSSLDIGKPMLDTASISMSAVCKPNQPVGILWKPGQQGASTQPAVMPSIVPEAPADGGLLVIMTVSEVDEQESIVRPGGETRQ